MSTLRKFERIEWNGKVILDLAGVKFNMLTVVKFDRERMDRRLAEGKNCADEYWLCKCECGNGRLKSIRSSDLYQDKIRSCGCLVSANKSNINKRLRKIYADMKQRCYNERNCSYKHYGAKGVKIHKAWLDDPNKFYEWAMKNGYEDNLTIDRIDAHKNYTPKNCRWVSKSEQAINKRETVYIVVNGKKKSISEWASLSEITIDEFYNRLKLGWNIKDACTVKNQDKHPLT